MEFYISNDTPVTKMNKHWEYCIGSGHAPLALRTDYVNQLKRIHEELGIRYVRFHGILNDDMEILMNLSDLNHIPGAEKFEQLSFRKVGLVYDNILACGMKPYVELSFMPKHLASDPERKLAFYYGGNISKPRDDNEWCEFIKAFVKYLIERYGSEEVESWPFEVWNEPDIFVFWSGTKAEYYHLYEITAKAIKEVDEKIQVGGPAASGSKWIGSFMEYCRERHVPLDFISSHQYAGDPIGGVEGSADMEEENRNDFVVPIEEMKGLFKSMPDEYDMLTALRTYMPDKSETEEISSDAFQINAAIVKQQAKGLPIYYSEWNANGIFSAVTNDTRKVAAYLVRTALNVEDYVTGSSVWCFSDIFEEFSNFPQEFHGGFGLLTNNGIPKPQYYALKMLHDAADNRLYLGEKAVDGEVGIAAFKDEDKMQILLFRQKMRNQDLPEEKVLVNVKLLKAPAKIYLERIDEKHCNPLKKWNMMGNPIDMTPAQIKEVEEYGMMEKEALDIKYENGILTFEARLGVNDVYFVTLEG